MYYYNFENIITMTIVIGVLHPAFKETVQIKAICLRGGGGAGNKQKRIHFSTEAGEQE